MAINSTLRGFGIIILIAALITALRLEDVLGGLFLVARIAFVAALVYFFYVLWRQRRHEIATWPLRPQLVLYGAAILALANLILAFIPALDYPRNGLEALTFFLVLAACAFAMWRVWRDQHTYGY